MKKIILKKTVVVNLSKDGMNALKGGNDTIIYNMCDSAMGGSCQCPESVKTTCYGWQTCTTICGSI